MSFEQTSSLIGVIVVFLLILYGSYFVSKKVAKMSVRESRSKYMRLHDQMMIGQEKYLAVVSIGGRYFLIGSSENGISLLTELEENDLASLQNSADSDTRPVFKDLMKKIGKDKNTKI